MDSVRAESLPAEPPLDVTDLLNRCLGRIEIVERILQKFQRTLGDDLQQLEDALSVDNTDQIAHIAHRIKGASLSVAAHNLCDVAQSIEASARGRKLEEIRRNFDKLRKECARIRDLTSLGTTVNPSPGNSGGSGGGNGFARPKST